MSRAAFLLTLFCLSTAPMLRASAAAEAFAETIAEMAGTGSAETTPEPDLRTAQLYAPTVERGETSDASAFLDLVGESLDRPTLDSLGQGLTGGSRLPAPRSECRVQTGPSRAYVPRC